MAKTLQLFNHHRKVIGTATLDKLIEMEGGIK